MKNEKDYFSEFNAAYRRDPVDGIENYIRENGLVGSTARQLEAYVMVRQASAMHPEDEREYFRLMQHLAPNGLDMLSFGVAQEKRIWEEQHYLGEQRDMGVFDWVSCFIRADSECQSNPDYMRSGVVQTMVDMYKDQVQRRIERVRQAVEDIPYGGRTEVGSDEER